MWETLSNFFGYGNVQSRMWVIGLEEHCGGEHEVAQRVHLRTAGPQQFREPLLDVQEFHEQLLGHMPAPVPVWDICSLVYFGVYEATTQLGRVDPALSDVLLGEIFPLPRAQHDQWPATYLAMFPTRQAYGRLARRSQPPRLLAMVAEHQPEVVILHGKSQHDSWINLKRFREMRDGWQCEGVVDHPAHTVCWSLRGQTLWLRTNNLVNNGHVRHGPGQIEQLVRIIRANRLSR